MLEEVLFEANQKIHTHKLQSSYVILYNCNLQASLLSIEAHWVDYFYRLNDD